MRIHGGILAIAVAAVAASACNELLGIEAFTGDDSGVQDGAPTGEAGDGADDQGGAMDALQDGLQHHDATVEADAFGNGDGPFALEGGGDATTDSGAPEGSSDDGTLPDGWTFDGGATFNCVGPADVPGLTGGPSWLPPADGGSWRSELHDPRWAGGPVNFFPVASGGSANDQFDAQYRFVYANNTLYVSIQVLQDSDGIDGLDAVYFGITAGSASLGAHLLEIPPDNVHQPSTCSTAHDSACPIPNGLGPINYYSTANRGLTPPTWSAQPAPPPWLSNVATWTSSPGVAWAVTFQIDTSSLTNGGFQMFFGTRIAMSGATALLLTSSSQATAATGSNPAVGDTPAGVNISDWENFGALGG